MAIPVEDTVAALSTFSLEDDQPDVQGLSIMLSTGRYATKSPIGRIQGHFLFVAYFKKLDIIIHYLENHFLFSN